MPHQCWKGQGEVVFITVIKGNHGPTEVSPMPHGRSEQIIRGETLGFMLHQYLKMSSKCGLSQHVLPNLAEVASQPMIDQYRK